MAHSCPTRLSAVLPDCAGRGEMWGEYLDRYRDYRFAQALYDVYARSSEEVAVETLAGETAANVQILEAPRLDADRKYNIAAAALLALAILAALFTDIYAPATGLRLFARKDGGWGQRVSGRVDL